MITDLAGIVSGAHRWLRYEQPFRHVIATDVFHPVVYKAMEDEFNGWLARGLSEQPTGADTQFSRAMGSYDAYGFNFTQARAGAFDVLLSPAWCQLIAGLFGITSTRHINLGLHHHLPGSQSGWPHTDLAPGWFAAGPPDPGSYALNDQRVDYHSGQSAPGWAGGTVAEVRAVAVLIYLANDDWHPGDGGETALFSGTGGDPSRPAAKVPPVNNSLLAFECTPFSFHTFLTNVRKPRNSLVMWLHRPKAEAVDRWADRSIVYWSKDGNQ